MKLTLGKKLGLGFASILALMLVSALLTHLKARSIQQTQDTAANLRVPLIKTCTELQRDLHLTMSKSRQVILAGNQQSRREQAQKLFDAAWEQADKDVAKLDLLKPRLTVQVNRERLAEVEKLLPALRGAQESAMIDAATGQSDAVVTAGNEFADSVGEVNKALTKQLEDLVESANSLLEQNNETVNAEMHSMNITVFGAAFVAIGVGLFVAISLGRGISGATQAVLCQAEAIAAGDLTRDDLNVRSRDELGDLTIAINKMSGSLKRMIMAITENSVQVATASEELKATSHQISANSEETSAQTKVASEATRHVSQNLQTVATGADEMGASIKDIAKNATEAARIAITARKCRRKCECHNIETGLVLDRDRAGD
jgi:methyl-accepting chemotaxis protein